MEFTRPEKDPRLLARHGKWEDPENGRAGKWTTRDGREVAQMTKMMTNLTKGKGIVDDLGLQRKPTSWEGCTNPSIEPNLDDPKEQGGLRKDPFGRSLHVDMQQRYSLLDKKLKEIEGVDDLGSVES